MKLSIHKLRPLALEILGWVLVLIGLAALVLPGPGLLALFAGLALLASRYDWAERRLEPVKKAALKAARDSVSNWPRIIATALIAIGLICFGVIWGIGPAEPAWWPINSKLWLFGGWGTGSTLIGSGVIVGAMLIYSYINFR